jgi:hypothetical protein
MWWLLGLLVAVAIFSSVGMKGADACEHDESAYAPDPGKTYFTAAILAFLIVAGFVFFMKASGDWPF